MEAGALTDSGLALVSRGEPAVQYAVQTSTRTSAGRFPHPILLAKPALA